MPVKPNPHMTDAENPPLTKADFAKMRAAREVLGDRFVDAQVAARKSKGGRPKAARTKTQVTVRLDPEIVDYFKARGPGWQSRLNESLRLAVAELRKGDDRMRAQEARNRPAARSRARKVS